MFVTSFLLQIIIDFVLPPFIIQTVQYRTMSTTYVVEPKTEKFALLSA
jgi:hypothetical protein